MGIGRTNVGGGRMPSYEIKINDKFSTTYPAPTSITKTYTIPEDGYYLLGLNTSGGDIGSVHTVTGRISFTGTDMSDGASRPIKLEETQTSIVNTTRAQTRLRLFTYLKSGTVVTYYAQTGDNATLFNWEQTEYNAYFAVKLSNNVDFTTVPLYPKISV